ncbi:MAG: efflux RND transporter periplasmic adaptor subunit, partial [Chloroflexi bacterium]|nr:efflux RND transporter periplasmic adaptor subunit [Chloroflexota bacterium]
MSHRRRIIPVVLLLIIVGGYYLYSTGRLPIGTAGATTANTLASGFIEGEEFSVAAEIGGRIEALSVGEGDSVTAGQELARLDRSLLDAQIKQAQAALDTAKAQVAQVKVGPRAEDVRQAEAALVQAVVLRDGAKRAWEDAKLLRDNPQELDARIATARAQVDTLNLQVEVARHQVEAATANAKAAEVRKDSFGGTLALRPDAPIAVNQWWAAEEVLLTARAALDVAQATSAGAQKSLDALLTIRARPLVADAQVNTANLQYESAAAAIDVAQARLDAVKAGVSKEQVAVVEAQVKQAEAALNVLLVQAAKTLLKSPATGVVTRKAVHTGELAAPGASLLTIVSLDPVKLTIFVPETQIGDLKIGDEIA